MSIFFTSVAAVLSLVATFIATKVVIKSLRKGESDGDAYLVSNIWLRGQVIMVISTIIMILLHLIFPSPVESGISIKAAEWLRRIANFYVIGSLVGVVFAGGVYEYMNIKYPNKENDRAAAKLLVLIFNFLIIGVTYGENFFKTVL